MPAHLQCFLITLKTVTLEKFSFSDTQNHKAVSWRIDSQWQTLSA